MEEKKMSYNEAYKKLQTIVELIETNRLDVDELSSKIREASELLKICKDKLFVANEETKKMLETLH